MGHKGSHICDVIFEDCRVPAANLIGATEGIGFKTAMKVLDKGLDVGTEASCAKMFASEMCGRVADRAAQQQVIARNMTRNHAGYAPRPPQPRPTSTRTRQS